MSTDSDSPSDMYVATYADPDAAKDDWDALQRLASDDKITLDGLILVSRGSDGKIHIEDNRRATARGAVWGLVGGAVAGLIFPPSVLVGAAIGAAYGAGVGGLMSLGDKVAIEADVAETLPVNGSGILVLFEKRWADTVDKSLARASKVAKWEVDGASVKQIKSSIAADSPIKATDP